MAPTTANVVMANVTHVFSPTLTNETVFTYARYINPLTPHESESDRSCDLRLQRARPVRRQAGTDSEHRLAGAATAVSPGIDSKPFSAGLITAEHSARPQADPAIYDNLSKVAGTHTMKFGFYWDANQNLQSSGGVLNGTYDFETYGSTTTRKSVRRSSSRPRFTAITRSTRFRSMISGTINTRCMPRIPGRSASGSR